MKPATVARARSAPRRVLVIDPSSGRFWEIPSSALPDQFVSGDVLVFNDAATLPAAFLTVDGVVELRLLAEHDDGTFAALAFGAGSWRMRTEDRPAPPPLEEGTRLAFRGGLGARVVGKDPTSPRLVRVRFEAEPDALWPALYRAGRPVQYSYLKEPLALWDVQTGWASRPWAMEPPCAGFALSWETLLALRRRGVRFAGLTHGASLSSAGEPSLDARLPWTERFDIPESTVAAVSQARAQGRRVIAIGTTVVRALEGAAASGSLQPGRGTTNLVVGPGFRPRVVSGILTGMHEPGDSHYRLLRAFAPEVLLAEAHRFADAAGFETHEFGDVALVLPAPIPRRIAAERELLAGADEERAAER